MTESALVQRQILQQRLEGEDAELHVTVATSRFVSAVRQHAPSSSSDSSETTAPFASIGSFIRSKSYAGVPISLVPGSGRNLVHPSNRQLNCSNRLCSATARLLDLQTLLELPLAALGIRMKKQPGDTQAEPYVWPDRARVEAIEVACAARDVVPESAISARALSSEDLSWKVWDFVQPERNLLVIIHIHIKAAFSQPDPISLALQPLLDNLANAPAGPREATFRSSVRPSCCVITRSTSELCEAAHIIPRSLDHKLVGDVMYELFGHMSPPAGSTTISPLFHRRKESYPGKPDDPRNGILLSPTLHKVFDNRRTIWILRSRCYLLAPPVCYEELRAFNPPCPSASRAPRSSNDEEDLELWAEQFKHEQKVQPLACADLTDAQQCLLHLSALLSFFELFMKPQAATEALLASFRKSEYEGRRPSSGGRRGQKDKKRKLNEETSTEPNEAQAETGTTADAGSIAGSANELNDQQQPERPKTQREWYPPTRPTSPPSSKESSPSKQGRACHDVAMKFPDTLTPNRSDLDNEIGSDSESDSKSHCDEEPDRDEDEERWQERLHNDTLALSFIKHSFSAGTEHFRRGASSKPPPSAPQAQAHLGPTYSTLVT